MAVEVLVGYKKFYALFAGLLLSARFVFGYQISNTAYLWSLWIFIWTSPPLLHTILALFSNERSAEELDQSIKRSASKEKMGDTKETVNNTPYYVMHLYGVCQAFSLVNVKGTQFSEMETTLSSFFFFFGWTLALVGFFGALWSRHSLGGEWRGAPEVRGDHSLVTAG